MVGMRWSYEDFRNREALRRPYRTSVSQLSGFWFIIQNGSEPRCCRTWHCMMIWMLHYGSIHSIIKRHDREITMWAHWYCISIAYYARWTSEHGGPISSRFTMATRWMHWPACQSKNSSKNEIKVVYNMIWMLSGRGPWEVARLARPPQFRDE